MKSIAITYFFLLMVVGLFLFTGNNASAKSVQSKNVKTEVMLIDSKTTITTTSYSEEKTHNVASSQLESFSQISFTDFNALIPPNEQRNYFRINIRFKTLKI